MSDKLSDDERARLDAEVKRDYEMSAKWPFDASDAWWNDDSRYVAPPAVDSAHAAARAIIRDLSDRGGIKRGFENIDEETRGEIVTKLAAIIRGASAAPAISESPEAHDEAALAWMTCESRRPFVVNSLRARAEDLRAAEKRCRNAYRKDFMGFPARYLADAYGEAATALEARLSAIDAPISGRAQRAQGSNRD
ncbi:hypothetical protein [Burkholderia gladioli]|uniref:hypothetical protein n=1 Tax=Burkholderia gladioli TaxID=28095 RepID=UPI0030CB9FC5